MASAHRIVVVGKTMSGKTYTARRLAAQLAGPRLDRRKVIIFDPLTGSTAENWRPAGRREVTTRAQLLRALEDWQARGDKAPIVVRGTFTEWAPLHRLEDFILIVDEARRYSSPNSIDPAWRDILALGRHRRIDTITATQGPSDLHPSVWGSMTLAAVHTVRHRAHLAAVAQHLGVDARTLRWDRVPGTAHAVTPRWYDGAGELIGPKATAPPKSPTHEP